VEAGWAVVAVDQDSDVLRSLSDIHREWIHTVTGDVCDYATNERAVQACAQHFGGIDAVIANAGVNLVRPIDTTTDQDFDRLMGVNAKAVMYLAQAAHPHLAASRGSLCVMASKTGLVAQKSSPLYCATKGAAVLLAKALALDWAEEGIRVNAVCPGIIDTPMLDSFIDDLPDSEQSRREMSVAQPLGRLGTAQECAAAAVFLSSPAASFISGVALPIDGGFTAQ
jgi:meso-butanediol dehydrogenase / (S,S)-butanediol dehydrogenase / diacetyl reductase